MKMEDILSTRIHIKQSQKCKMNEGVNVMKKDESDSSHALFEITG